MVWWRDSSSDESSDESSDGPTDGSSDSSDDTVTAGDASPAKPAPTVDAGPAAGRHDRAEPNAIEKDASGEDFWACIGPGRDADGDRFLDTTSRRSDDEILPQATAGDAEGVGVKKEPSGEDFWTCIGPGRDADGDRFLDTTSRRKSDDEILPQATAGDAGVKKEPSGEDFWTTNGRDVEAGNEEEEAVGGKLALVGGDSDTDDEEEEVRSEKDVCDSVRKAASREYLYDQKGKDVETKERKSAAVIAETGGPRFHITSKAAVNAEAGGQGFPYAMKADVRKSDTREISGTNIKKHPSGEDVRAALDANIKKHTSTGSAKDIYENKRKSPIDTAKKTKPGGKDVPNRSTVPQPAGAPSIDVSQIGDSDDWTATFGGDNSDTRTEDNGKGAVQKRAAPDQSEQPTVRDETIGEIQPKKLLAALPTGLKTCMGELMSSLKKSKTEGDALFAKKRPRRPVVDRRDVDDVGRYRRRKLRRRLPKLNCTHAFCEKLMARFHAVVMEREAAGNPVELRLSQMADQLHSVIAEHIEGTVSRMLEAAETECPHVLLADVQQAIRTSCHERVRLALPADQVRSRLQQGGGTDLADAVNELHLAVAAQVSDRIVDEVIESLSRTYQELTGDVSRKRASTPDVLKSHSKPCDGAGAGADVSEKSSSADTLHLSPPATPQLQVKKMNLHGRKLRPKSVVDSVEGVSAERIPDLLPSLDPCQEEMDTVAELPASSYQLRHLGKARPRRAKTRAPTRAAVVGEEEAELDSGLDVFFQPARSLPSSPLTSPDSETRQLMTTSADNTPHMGLERTWRTAGLRDENGAQGERRSSGAVKKGISSVFSKLAADRVARSREDRDGIVKPGSRKSTDTVDSDSSAGSGSADSFLNHLLSPPVLPPGEDSSEPALRRPAGLGGADLMAEMKKKQEKRASLTPKHTPDEFEERSPVLSPLQGVKSRPVSIKSPTYADDGPPSISPKPGLAARLSKQASPLPGLYRPSPLGPKPRPKSMAGRTENRSSSGGSVSWDETAASPVDASQNSTSQTGRQVADLPGANGAARTGEAASDGSDAPSPERQPKRLTSAELESLLESSVDGPQSLSGQSSGADSVGAPAPVPNLVLDQAYSLEDVINV